MATWYSTGTVAVTNGNTTVTGTGTAWVTGKVQIGDAMHLPNGRAYEISAVVSETEITLARGYEGSTGSGQAYQVQPTRGLIVPVINLIQGFNAALAGYVAGALAGKFGNGTSSAPSISFTGDADTGFWRAAANKIGMVVGGTTRASLSGTALEVNVPMTGTAVTQSAADTTSGRLLKVGDFGVGETASTVYRRDNIVGSVSQAAGVPTAAIVERGSNANGQYVKFADGTQICWIGDGPTAAAETASGAIYLSSSNVNWTYPASFINAEIFVSGSSHVSVRWVWTHTSNSTNAVFRHFQGSSSSTQIATRLMAIGRWF